MAAGWYNFSGPVQGGFGPDDEKRRKRRDVWRDAGAPYQGGASGGIEPDATGQYQASGPFAGDQAAYDAWGTQPQQGAAPRAAAAVDLGQGAQQQPLNIEPVQAQYMIEGRTGSMDPAQQQLPSVRPKAVSAGVVPQLPTDPSETTEATVLRESRPYSGVPKDDVQRTYGPIRGRPQQRSAPYWSSSSSKVSGLLEAGDSLQNWGYEDPDAVTAVVPVPAKDTQRAVVPAKDPQRAVVPAKGTQRATSYGPGEQTRFRRPPGFEHRPARPQGLPKADLRGDRPGTGGYGPEKRTRKDRFDPLRPFRGPHQARLPYRGGEWKSRAPTAAERQKFPEGFQPTQQHEYAKHREATEKGLRFKFPPGVQPSQAEEYARSKKRKVGFAATKTVHTIPKGKEHRYTGGRAVDVEPSEREGYMQYGRMLGARDAVAKERRKTRRQIADIKKQNKQFVEALRKRGTEQLQQREKQLQDMSRQGGQLVQQMHNMQQAGETLEARVRAGSRQLTQRDARIRGLKREGDQLYAKSERQGARIRELEQGMGREGLRAQRAEERVGQLLQEGRSLEAEHKARMKRGEEQIAARDKAYGDLMAEANRKIQGLEKRLNDGTADREAAQKEIDELTKQLAAASKKPEAKGPEQKQDLSELKKELAGMRREIKARPAAAQGGAPPIVVQGGQGGGGASAGGSSSSGGAAAGGQGGGGGRDLSRTVEALAKAVKGARKSGAAPAKKKAEGTKGITQARRSYTDKRKSKIAELRALKSKRIREFNARTKKMPKAERDKARREFKKKVNAQFKEAQQRFPTARGLKTVAAIRELIRKLDAFRPAK
ncbi:MAG: hypothetical protein CL928_04175 [Deltaproteobacteria bacterium]|nr:hypothetical protein [Deltaproteobacteria bacterium]